MTRLPFARGQTSREQNTQIHFCSCDLDLDPMTLIGDLALDILKTYLLTRNELSRSTLSKVTRNNNNNNL